MSRLPKPITIVAISRKCLFFGRYPFVVSELFAAETQAIIEQFFLPVNLEKDPTATYIPPAPLPIPRALPVPGSVPAPAPSLTRTPPSKDEDTKLGDSAKPAATTAGQAEGKAEAEVAHAQIPAAGVQPADDMQILQTKQTTEGIQKSQPNMPGTAADPKPIAQGGESSLSLSPSPSQSPSPSPLPASHQVEDPCFNKGKPVEGIKPKQEEKQEMMPVENIEVIDSDKGADAMPAHKPETTPPDTRQEQPAAVITTVDKPVQEKSVADVPPVAHPLAELPKENPPHADSPQADRLTEDKSQEVKTQDTKPVEEKPNQDKPQDAKQEDVKQEDVKKPEVKSQEAEKQENKLAKTPEAGQEKQSEDSFMVVTVVKEDISKSEKSEAPVNPFENKDEPKGDTKPGEGEKVGLAQHQPQQYPYFRDDEEMDDDGEVRVEDAQAKGDHDNDEEKEKKEEGKKQAVPAPRYPLMERLMSLLWRPGEMNSVLAGYFAKLVLVLMEKYKEEFQRYIFSHRYHMDNFIRQSKNTSIAELIYKLLSDEDKFITGLDGKEFGPEKLTVIDQLLDCLQPGHPDDMIANCCNILCRLVDRKLYLDRLISESTLEKLFVLAQTFHPASMTAALKLLITFNRLKKVPEPKPADRSLSNPDEGKLEVRYLGD
jgi:hypothetical protein